MSVVKGYKQFRAMYQTLLVYSDRRKVEVGILESRGVVVDVV